MIPNTRYEQGLLRDLARDDIPDPIESILQQAFKRRWRHLAEERIKNVKPSIPLGRRFWTVSAEENREIARLFQSTEVQDLVTCLRKRGKNDEIEVLDAAYWVKGCSSLGRLRYAVLIGIGRESKQDRFCLFDIKEATNAVAPRTAKVSMPRDNAKRIVEGARNLSPFLGERMLATRFLDRAVVARELLPQDLKLELEQSSQKEIVAAAHFLSGVVGIAHSRQMEKSIRAEWISDVTRSRSKSLDAPSWLWTSIVELVSVHEVSYLEHCRKYAMQGVADNE